MKPLFDKLRASIRRWWKKETDDKVVVHFHTASGRSFDVHCIKIKDKKDGQV